MTRATSAERGTLLLTLAQVWHAVSGYVVFFTGGRILGLEDYGGFALVVWTMTTLEVFVVDGVPRALSYHVARHPKAASELTAHGLRATLLVALGLGGVLVLAAPLLGHLWRASDLVPAIRLSALDFLAFAGFAVVVQAVNGLHEFGRQALVWIIYSTSKVLAVGGFLLMGFGLEGGVLGFVVASFIGSVAAWALGRPRLIGAREKSPLSARGLWAFGLPLATQAMALMAIVNVDLWAAKGSGDDDATVGAYTGAATLARALFFVFRAFADALFPAVSRAVGQGDLSEARRVAKKSFALLTCLLVPAAGLATGAAEPVLVTLYDNVAFGRGAPFLHLLAPAAVAWTLIAVTVALLAAAARPWRAAGFLAVLLVAVTAAVYGGASAAGSYGAATGALMTGAAGLVAALVLLSRTLVNLWVPRTFLAAALISLGLHAALSIWVPPGWWVFPYGAVLYAGAVGLLRSIGAFRST